MKFNFKKGLLLGSIFVVIPLVAWFGYNQWSFLQFGGAQSHQAVGVLKEVGGDQLIIFGNHTNDSTPSKVDYSQRRDLVVIVKPETKFIKLAWYLPESFESLAKNKTQLNQSDIKKEKLDGSVDELKNIKGTSVTVKTKGNTIKKNVFEATEVEYTTFVYPK